MTQGSDMELRELIESFFSTSMRASSPRKIDMMVDALKEHKQRSIDRAVADSQPDWWITTGLKDNGKKLLGPFSTRDLALSVRTYMEMAEAPATYWVEKLSPTTTEDKEERDE